MRGARQAAKAAAVGLLAIASVMAARARHGPSPENDAVRAESTSADDRWSDDVGREVAAEAAAHLSALIRCATVSRRAPASADLAQFDALHAAIDARFPLLTAALECEAVGDRGRMYRWPGTGRDAHDSPLVLMAHLDVVPAEDGGGWRHSPFSGHNDGDRVWGRGALDDKGPLVVILAAVEHLLAEGFRPARDVYLCLGDNEETAGATAQRMADMLAERGVTPFLVLDEGGAVVEGDILPGVTEPAAMIGVAEKGLLDVELAVVAPGGHASTPPRRGATARIARAVWRLERPFPSHLPAPTREMVETLGRHAPFVYRLVYANLAILARPFTLALQSAGPETAALTRTTVAVTQLSASPAVNVLAESATAGVNLRLAVGTTSEAALARLREVIADENVRVRVLSSSEPSRVSRTDNEAFALLRASVRAAFPDAIPAPYVMNQATDSRRFAPRCDSVYRFAPLRMSSADRRSLHGSNESVRIATLGEGVRFMVDLIRRVDER